MVFSLPFASTPWTLRALNVIGFLPSVVWLAAG
jgi:hypothetical protein